MSETKKRQLIEWRRSQEFDLLSQGHTITEIGKILQVSKGTVSKDVKTMVLLAKERTKSYVERLPLRHEQNLRSLDMVQQHLWKIVNESQDSREKIAALMGIKDTVATTEELMVNGDMLSQGIDSLQKKEAAISKMYTENAKLRVDMVLAGDQLKQQIEEARSTNTSTTVDTTANNTNDDDNEESKEGDK